MATSTAKCPRCGSGSYAMREVTEAIKEWEVVDGQFDPRAGADDCGDIIQVTCICRNCRHEWTPRRKGERRNALMITDFCEMQEDV